VLREGNKDLGSGGDRGLEKKMRREEGREFSSQRLMAKDKENAFQEKGLFYLTAQTVEAAKGLS